VVAVLCVPAIVAIGAFCVWQGTLDVDAWALREVSSVRGGSDEARAALSRFHRGEPPCDEYQSPTPPAAEVAAMVDELKRAGTLDDFIANADAVGGWARKDEAERHGPASDDELCARIAAEHDWTVRITLALHCAEVAKTARREDASVAWVIERNQRRLERAIPPTKYEALQKFYGRHRGSLGREGLMSLFRAATLREALHGPR